MRPLVFALAAILSLAVTPKNVSAETLICPNLAAATQVGTCPTDAQLRYAFAGYCGDDRRMYDKDSISCADMDQFKKLKNNSLWETKDEKFQGYVDCTLSSDQVKSAKVYRIQIQPAGKISRVICDYDHEIAFVHRSRTACKITGSGDCAANPANCKAECE
jgi:hypothetical protein